MKSKKMLHILFYPSVDAVTTATFPFNFCARAAVVDILNANCLVKLQNILCVLKFGTVLSPTV